MTCSGTRRRAPTYRREASFAHLRESASREESHPSAESPAYHAGHMLAAAVLEVWKAGGRGRSLNLAAAEAQASLLKNCFVHVFSVSRGLGAHSQVSSKHFGADEVNLSNSPLVAEAPHMQHPARAVALNW